MFKPKCEREDCFANENGLCSLLKVNDYQDEECPFYKHYTKVSKNKIENEIRMYEYITTLNKRP